MSFWPRYPRWRPTGVPKTHFFYIFYLEFQLKSLMYLPKLNIFFTKTPIGYIPVKLTQCRYQTYQIQNGCQDQDGCQNEDGCQNSCPEKILRQQPHIPCHIWNRYMYIFFVGIQTKPRHNGLYFYAMINRIFATNFEK